MSMYALLRNNPTPRMADIEEAFQGNLCRCTGYRPILEGYKTFTKERSCCGGKGMENGCCMTNRVETKGYTDESANSTSVLPAPLYNPADFLPLDPTQEIIFPPELMVDTLTHQYTRGLNTNTYPYPSLY
ncbi:unnamed protein product, partial [Oncorhynchus mykiss]